MRTLLLLQGSTLADHFERKDAGQHLVHAVAAAAVKAILQSQQLGRPPGVSGTLVADGFLVDFDTPKEASCICTSITQAKDVPMICVRWEEKPQTKEYQSEQTFLARSCKTGEVVLEFSWWEGFAGVAKPGLTPGFWAGSTFQEPAFGKALASECQEQLAQALAGSECCQRQRM